MRKLVVMENLSLDGVMQAPGRASEDPRGGFAHGGWSRPYNDPVMGKVMATGMTNVGPLTISFDIEANSLADAVAKYADATKAGVDRAMRELQEMRRQASSSIVLPPAGATLGPGGTLPGGGGKIQIP